MKPNSMTQETQEGQTPTPRTDYVEGVVSVRYNQAEDCEPHVNAHAAIIEMADFARTLERELAQACARCAELEGLLRESEQFIIGMELLTGTVTHSGSGISSKEFVAQIRAALNQKEGK